MERSENRDADHITDIGRNSDTSSPAGQDNHHDGERPSSSSTLPIPRSSSASSSDANSRNSSFTRRSEGYGGRRWSMFSSGIWISIELVVTLSQIVASIVVLSLSRHENPQTLLFAWVVGYALGCVATLPLLYWRFLHRNQGTEQDLAQTRQDAFQNDHLPQPSPLAFISLLRGTDEEDHQTAVSSSRIARVNVLLVYRFKRALHRFFVVWISVGNIWIFGFGWHSPSADAPNLYRLCIWFLKFCCLGVSWKYAAHAIINLWSSPGAQEDSNHTRRAVQETTRGAAIETINDLPTYKFRLKDRNGDARDTISGGIGESGGTLEAGTEKERTITGKDAVCCICLEEYADNDELRELPCAHFFHVDCVDKWLKKRGVCPLCKRGIGNTSVKLHTFAVYPDQQSVPE